MRPLHLCLHSSHLCASARAQGADIVLTMNSYGPIQVGMRVADVRRLLLNLGHKHLPKARKAAKAGCDYYRASDHLRFMLENGKVVRIETSERNVVTPSGIRIGTTLERVRTAFGSRIEDMQQKYSENAGDRTIVLVSGDHKFAIRVEGNRTVSELFAGAEGYIRYAEGCA